MATSCVYIECFNYKNTKNKRSPLNIAHLSNFFKYTTNKSISLNIAQLSNFSIKFPQPKICDKLLRFFYDWKLISRFGYMCIFHFKCQSLIDFQRYALKTVDVSVYQFLDCQMKVLLIRTEKPTL